jgi:multisubunit Na+/H+ antiporter MnhB subunit
MRYLTVGYHLILFSPLLSLVLLVAARAQLGVTALIIGVQICGMILYLVGYRKPSKPSETPPLILLSGVFLVVWGLLIAWYLITWHNFHITHYLPEKPLTFWDNVNYAAYVLKGLLWVASGLMLIITRMSKTFRVHKA